MSYIRHQIRHQIGSYIRHQIRYHILDIKSDIKLGRISDIKSDIKLDINISDIIYNPSLSFGEGSERRLE